MVKIIEIHYTIANKDNFQSRIIEEESFEVYKENLIRDGNSKFPYQSIPRQCKLENLETGDGWLECKFINPAHGAIMKHIAWELTLNKDKSVTYESTSNFRVNEPINDAISDFVREYECDFLLK